jgi:hypothetical protein
MSKILRIILASIAGLVLIIEGYWDFGMNIFFVFGVICGILVFVLVWFGLKYFYSSSKNNRDLLIASLCAVIAPILWMIISGPGREYYYKYVYPIGESQTYTGVSGGGCVTVTIVGICALVYAGWIEVKKKGWSQLKYIFLLIGIFFLIFFAVIIIAFSSFGF